MENYVLKEQIKRVIAEKKVLAVMVHTFNFSPVFFENYVMPIFVNDNTLAFRDEEIYNRILWKDCARKDVIPPITVYCDFYAKDNTKVPSLGYDIYCIKMPGAKGHICNFHPKQLFILLKDKKTEKESLVMLTGSGNITPGGWCDNFESFSMETINKNKIRPNSSNTNELQDYLDNVADLYDNKNVRTASHVRIHNFLNYVDLNISFFNSLQISFTNFLEDQIPLEEVVTLEIISPYFSERTDNIDWLKSKGITDIRCLIPRLLSNEILLKEETFLDYRDQGIQWSEWANEELNKEMRNVHAKIYCFHTQNVCYTIIGSVNFTNPAWKRVSDIRKNNTANVETAWLYERNYDSAFLLNDQIKLDLDKQIFIDKLELEGDSAVNDFFRDAPDLNFSIDWRREELTIRAKIKTTCTFCGMLSNQEIEDGKSIIEMSEKDMKYFSKQGLIKVEVQQKGRACFYYYYVNHINIENKPLGIKLSPDIILRYWQFLGDNYHKNKLSQRIAEAITDENGGVVSEKMIHKSSLNEMAANYVGIVRLENFLFKNDLRNIKEKKAQFKLLEYYLLSDNVDTIPFYLKELKTQNQQNKFQNSSLWMVLQIIINNFYEVAISWEYRKVIESKQFKPFTKALKLHKVKLIKEAENLSSNVKGLKGKKEWFIRQIKEKYD